MAEPNTPGSSQGPGAFRTLRRVADGISTTMNVVGTLLIVALMVLVNTDVIGREAFLKPVVGVPEIVSISIVGIVFLQVSEAFRRGRFTRTESLLFVIERHAPRLRLWVELVYLLAAAALITVLVKASYPLFAEAWSAQHLCRHARHVHRARLADQRGHHRRLRRAVAADRSIDRRGADRAVRRRVRSGGVAMSSFEIGIATLFAMVALIYAGLWVPVALMLCSYVGVWMIKGSPLLAGKLLALAASETISSYFFGVVPLFVLMGFLVSVTGMGSDAYDVANQLFRRVKGGLGVSTVAANAVFAAITGISIASAAVFTRIAVPEMVRHGYTKRFSVGVVAGSSVLGMLIPPSLLLILYGLLTEQSVGDLFMAGILPGILLAAVFTGGVIAMAYFWPSFIGHDLSPDDEHKLTTGQMMARGLPIAALIALVLGGIYGGLFTPIEAGAVGCLGTLVIGAFRRKLTPANLWSVLNDTGLVTASICFLIISAQMYSRMLALSGVPNEFGAFVAHADIGIWGVLAAYVVLVVAMGTILDSSSIMLIMVPLMLPVIQPMGIDLVWFGVVTVIAVEIGLLTPPFGISVFVIKSTLDDDTISLGDIFRGAGPFAVMMAFVLLLVLLFPSKATLPLGR